MMTVTPDFIAFYNITQHGLDWPWNLANISAVPSKPGVYVLKTAAGKPQYVGKSEKDLSSRIRDHYPNDIPAVNLFDWYATRTAQAADVLEVALIKAYNPPYNKQVG